MIRVLAIGPEATDWATKLRALAPGGEFEAARLPAAAVRSFERSPADLVLLCGPAATGRLTQVLAALRQRPLGELVPCIAVSDAALDGADASFDLDAEPLDVLTSIVEFLEVPIDELRTAGDDQPAPTPRGEDTPVTEAVIQRKLRQVRHETYFDVLEVDDGAAAMDLSDAFARLSARFGPHHVSAELARRFGAELAEVRDGLEDAFAVLSNDRLRLAYVDLRTRS